MMGKHQLRYVFSSDQTSEPPRTITTFVNWLNFVSVLFSHKGASSYITTISTLAG